MIIGKVEDGKGVTQRMRAVVLRHIGRRYPGWAVDAATLGLRFIQEGDEVYDGSTYIDCLGSMPYYTFPVLIQHEKCGRSAWIMIGAADDDDKRSLWITACPANAKAEHGLMQGDAEAGQIQHRVTPHECRRGRWAHKPTQVHMRGPGYVPWSLRASTPVLHRSGFIPTAEYFNDPEIAEAIRRDATLRGLPL